MRVMPSEMCVLSLISLNIRFLSMNKHFFEIKKKKKKTQQTQLHNWNLKKNNNFRNRCQVAVILNMVESHGWAETGSDANMDQ